jgi:hypothetical protein
VLLTLAAGVAATVITYLVARSASTATCPHPPVAVPAPNGTAPGCVGPNDAPIQLATDVTVHWWPVIAAAVVTAIATAAVAHGRSPVVTTLVAGAGAAGCIVWAASI